MLRIAAVSTFRRLLGYGLLLVGAGIFSRSANGFSPPASSSEELLAPIAVRKVDRRTVVFQLAKTYGGGKRLFDGLAILPRHLLEKTYIEGKNSVGNFRPAVSEPYVLSNVAQLYFKNNTENARR
jgi:hypothetical protein